jgi:hypothetical protein
VKNLLEVSRYREEDKIKMENERIEWGDGVDLINLAQDRDGWWAVVNWLRIETGGGLL